MSEKKVKERKKINPFDVVVILLVVCLLISFGYKIYDTAPSREYPKLGFPQKKKSTLLTRFVKKVHKFPFYRGKAAFSVLPENVCQSTSFAKQGAFRLGSRSSVTAMAVASEFHRAFLLTSPCFRRRYRLASY